MIDLNDLMAQLSSKRKVFHSEADFQHALAWQIHEAMPDCEIRLEFNPVPDAKRRVALDIWIPTKRVAIELKYPTHCLDATVSGERFVLKEQSARDQTRYDYFKDIKRLEGEVTAGRARQGFAVMLTNDRSYWQPPQRETIDAAFRIHEGRRVEGELAWSSSAGKGTTRGLEDPIRLKGCYDLRYKDYSDLPVEKYGRFRFLVVSVASPL